jgi:ABC-type multidrug transport system permease subunit
MALLTSGFALAQSGNMMNGGGWMNGGSMGGYGGIWTILLVIVVVGLLASIFKRGGK